MEDHDVPEGEYAVLDGDRGHATHKQDGEMRRQADA